MLEVKDLHKYYGSFHAVRGIGFDVARLRPDPDFRQGDGAAEFGGGRRAHHLACPAIMSAASHCASMVDA